MLKADDNAIVKLYFDSSVYAFVEARDEARGVRTWLRRKGHDLFASDEADLGEAIRTRDPTTRARRIRIVTSIARLSEPPTDLVMAKELLGEINRCHPEWISRYPSLRSQQEYMARRRRQSWSPFKADPSADSPTAQFFLGRVHRVLGANRAGARARREIRTKGGAIYKDFGRFARWQMEMDWRLLLLDPTTPGAEHDWLGPCLDLPLMFRQRSTDWERFCATEVDLNRVRMNYFSLAIIYSQTGTSIGDTVDRIHACNLLTFDRVVTADKRFFSTMQRARAIAPTTGEPVLIDRGAPSVVGELQRALR